MCGIQFMCTMVLMDSKHIFFNVSFNYCYVLPLCVFASIHVVMALIIKEKYQPYKKVVHTYKSPNPNVHRDDLKSFHPSHNPQCESQPIFTPSWTQ
jgi:hypothetical protein